MKQHKAQKKKKKFMAKLDHINTITVLSLVTSSAKPLINLLFSLFLSFLRHLLSSLTTTKPPRKSAARDDVVTAADDAVLRHSSISRALSQTLYMVTEVPVSSRKYDPVRSLAEQIVENNSWRVNDSYRCDVLRDVNRYGLSEAFVRTLSRLERLVLERRGGDTCPGGLGDGKDEEVSRLDGGEKLAAELVWLADMMAACGVGDEAVRKWGEASELASVAHLAEPRLQSILVKITGGATTHKARQRVKNSRNTKQEIIRATTTSAIKEEHVIVMAAISMPSMQRSRVPGIDHFRENPSREGDRGEHRDLVRGRGAGASAEFMAPPFLLQSSFRLA
ncbi:hypothetical protein Syun_003461 [Stephania yunnanensis]|uniref:Uncharacterized protein n=1 Tax=Stephania yunnanensis TaxID=152371 RepID=A0AAP0L3A1_9MAGN